MSDLAVTFKAITVEDGTGPLDIRVLIPKGRYILVAEDNGYYYLQPVATLSQHVAGPSHE